MYDVIVIGGGPGRAPGSPHSRPPAPQPSCCSTRGDYRNDRQRARCTTSSPTTGRRPRSSGSAARKDLAGYATVEVVDDEVAKMSPRRRPASRSRRSGGAVAPDARAVILATGYATPCPTIPGIARPVGHASSRTALLPRARAQPDGVVAVQGGPHATRLAAMLAPIAGGSWSWSTVRFTVPSSTRESAPRSGGRLVALRVEVRRRRRRWRPEPIYVDGFFVAGETRARRRRSPTSSGSRLLPSGCIEIDAFGRTSRPRVYAAGDLAHQAVVPDAARVGAARSRRRARWPRSRRSRT